MAKQGWDVPTLRRIFTLDHPDFVCDPVVVKMDRDHYWVNGSRSRPGTVKSRRLHPPFESSKLRVDRGTRHARGVGMTPKRPEKDPPTKPTPAGEIRFSPEYIAIVERSAGRSLRSEVPDLPPERRPKG
jgi:hypothetical protein